MYLCKPEPGQQWSCIYIVQECFFYFSAKHVVKLLRRVELAERFTCLNRSTWLVDSLLLEKPTVMVLYSTAWPI